MHAQDEKLDIIQEIGDSTKFGVLLLQDKWGTALQGISDKKRNYEILQRWIQGGGRTPVTWKTLVDVLKEAELNRLASNIESSLL